MRRAEPPGFFGNAVGLITTVEGQDSMFQQNLILCRVSGLSVPEQLETRLQVI